MTGAGEEGSGRKEEGTPAPHHMPRLHTSARYLSADRVACYCLPATVGRRFRRLYWAYADAQFPFHGLSLPFRFGDGVLNYRRATAVLGVSTRQTTHLNIYILVPFINATIGLL